MIKKLLIAVIVLSSLAACKGKDAFNYNQELVKKERDLIPEVEQTENKVAEYIGNLQYDSISIAGAHMEKLIDDELQKVANEPAPDVTGGADFKQAWIKYFTFLKSMYTGYKSFGAAKTDETREEEMTKLQNIVAGKEGAIADIKAAQMKFASANGFKMEK